MKTDSLPSIPDKKYFLISEVSNLCQIKPHTLRFWEKEFEILKPKKRRGNRRFYQKEDILIIREIKNLLYLEGMTISGAKKRLIKNKLKDEIPSKNQLIDELETILKELRKAV